MKENKFETLKGLILTGEKVEDGAYKNPIVKPGFVNDRPRLSAFFNRFEHNARGDGISLIFDINSILIILQQMISTFAVDEEKEYSHVIKVSKFTEDGVYTGELEVKGILHFGVDKKGFRYIRLETASGLPATFKFKSPKRVNISGKNVDKIDSEISKFYGIVWAKAFRDAVVAKIIATMN